MAWFGVQASGRTLMNLWETLGVSPQAGIGIAIAGLIAAALFAGHRLRSSGDPKRIRVDLGGRG
jgi:hypothetical protein